MSMPTTRPNAREALKRRILDLLDAEGQRMTAYEVAMALDRAMVWSNFLRRALNDLVGTGEVAYKKVSREAATYRTEREGEGEGEISQKQGEL